MHDCRRCSSVVRGSQTLDNDLFDSLKLNQVSSVDFQCATGIFTSKERMVLRKDWESFLSRKNETFEHKGHLRNIETGG
jgi:hypothetical protein